jgi:tRNA threonylcarbamoyladenosine modification (KEOPS) complex  Pcc1 subunit
MKLIIPNSLDALMLNSTQLDQYDKAFERHLATRSIWLLNPGDAIILPKLVPKDFLNHVMKTKNCKLDDFCIITLDEPFRFVTQESLSKSKIIMPLKKIIANPAQWTIEPYIFNQTIVDLAKELNIYLPEKWQTLIRENYNIKLNSKAEFRSLASTHDILLPAGEICQSLCYFEQAVRYFLNMENQVIIKKEISGGGMGNIGISFNPNARFSGVSNTVIVENVENLSEILEYLWFDNVDNVNLRLIVEIYYPDSETFTAEMFVPEPGQLPQIMNVSEIRMDGKCIGVEIPAHKLSSLQTKKIINSSMRMAIDFQAKGYYGYMSCDVIRTSDDKILFTEINARESGALYIYRVAEYLLGLDYQKKVTTLTRRTFKIKSFQQGLEILAVENLQYNPATHTGIIILSISCGELPAECLIVAPDRKKAYALESQLLKLFNEVVNVINQCI